MISKKKKATNEQLKLSSPWQTIYNKIYNLLHDDDELTISNLSHNDSEYIFSISSQNTYKINALEKVLKNNYEFGEVTLKIKFLVSNDSDKLSLDDFEIAFSGNPNFVGTVSASKGLYDLGYIIFAKDIIQFFNDDLSDIYGNFNAIVADIAKDVCNIGAHMNICTANGTEE